MPPRRITLHRWASLRSELLWVQDGPLVPPTAHQEADHRTGYWLWYIRKGSVLVQSAGGSLSARAGQWMITPQEPIMQDFSDGARILSLHFHCHWPDGRNLFEGTEGYVVEASAYPRLTKIGEELSRLARKHFPGVRTDFPFQSAEYAVFLTFGQTFSRLLIEFSDLFLARGRQPARTGELEERVRAALECLNEAPLEDGFPTGELRRRTGLGRAYLDRMFLREFQVTTHGHWDRLRQECAVRSLHGSSLSIKEISYRVGFHQTANFTKWFAKKMGMTPTQYRARVLESYQL